MKISFVFMGSNYHSLARLHIFEQRGIMYSGLFVLRLPSVIFWCRISVIPLIVEMEKRHTWDSLGMSAFFMYSRDLFSSLSCLIFQTTKKLKSQHDTTQKKSQNFFKLSFKYSFKLHFIP